MAISSKNRDKLRAAFADDKLVSEDDVLPVGIPHAERVPVRGSVLICSMRIISRKESDKRFKKTFSTK